MLAKREHQKNLPIVLKKVLKAGTVPALQIDTIAVTYGPGLSPCLWTGLNFAQDLAREWAVPLVPVDHIEGHLLIACWISAAMACMYAFVFRSFASRAWYS